MTKKITEGTIKKIRKSIEKNRKTGSGKVVSKTQKKKDKGHF